MIIIKTSTNTRISTKNKRQTRKQRTITINKIENAKEQNVQEYNAITEERTCE